MLKGLPVLDIERLSPVNPGEWRVKVDGPVGRPITSAGAADTLALRDNRAMDGRTMLVYGH